MIKKKIIAALVVGSLISGIVAWYGMSVYAQGEGKQEQKPELGKGYGYTQMLQIRADILEITAEELQEELNAGKNIHNIIEEKGLTSEEFDQKMLAAVRKRLESMVEAGLLTQEQLETRMQLMQQHYEDRECDEDCDCDCDENSHENKFQNRDKTNAATMGKGLGMLRQTR
jgi:hypothetical protein